MRFLVRFVSLILVASLGIAFDPMPSAEAATLTQVVVRGRVYYLDVAVAGRKATVWLRVRANASSVADVRAAELSVGSGKFPDPAVALCTAKRYYDGGKTLIGCVASAGALACTAGAVPTGGTVLALCSATVLYAANQGFAACLDGVSGEIARRLGREADWNTVRLLAKVSDAQFIGAIDKAIDLMCTRRP
jgi:hypothetical protein